MTRVDPRHAAQEAQRQFDAGQALHRLGKTGLAESHYLRVVKLDPAHADAWHLLGVIAHQQGHPAKAVKHYRRALAARPRFAPAWNNLALALNAQGQRDDARAAYREALAIRPEYVEAGFNLAIAETAAGDLAAAEAAYRQVLAWSPDSLPALTNLGNLLRMADRAVDALVPLQRAHQLAGDAASACNLALALVDAGRHADARALAETATREAPDDAFAWATLGTAARLAGDPDAAEAALARATALAPDDFGAWHELAQVREAAGDDVGAHAAFDRARALAPDDERLRWASLLSVPVLPADDAAIDAAIARFRAGVDELAKTPPRDPKAALAAAASVTPFALHYLPRDTRAACDAFGDLVRQVVVRAWTRHAQPPSPRDRGDDARVRVGVVGSHWRDHTVARYFAALIERLDPAIFDVHLWMTGETTDATTARIAASVSRFTHHTGDLDALADALRDARHDVIVHGDIGMDPRQHVLAAARLAPAQAVLYGHPASSGLPTLDAFFSGDAIEPVDGASHYREPLVRLPGLGAAFTAGDATPDRVWFDALRDGRPVALCAQAPNKMPPAFDALLARVVASAGARLLVFDRHAALTHRWIARARPAWSAIGVDIDDALLVLPAQPYPRFIGALAAAEIVLDTPWFSGGASSLDAIAVAAPVVTSEAPFARGRQTAAMLRLVDAPDLIARDDDDYVAIATRVMRDDAYRLALRDRLRANAKHLFAHDDVHAAFARALLRLAGRDGG